MPILGVVAGFFGFLLSQRAAARLRTRPSRALPPPTLSRAEDRPSPGWEELVRRAPELGLQVAGTRLTGAPHGVHVDLSAPRGAAGAELVLDGVHRSLQLSSAGVDARDKTGDKQFDIKYSISSDFESCGGTLDATGRIALVTLLGMAGRVSVEGGRLHVQLDRWLLDRGDPVLTLSRTLEVAVAATLALRTREEPHWLEALATGDLDAGVRLRALRGVLKTRPHASASELAQRLLKSESDPDLRGEAALICEDAEVLRGLPPDAIHRLHDLHGDPLTRLLEARGDEGLTLQVLRTLGEQASVSLVQAIGRTGTILSLGEIHALADNGRLEPALRKAAREAFAAIEARMFSSTGALSLAEGDEGGELAVVPHAGEVALVPHAGELAVVPHAGGLALVPEVGRVSLPQRETEEG